MFRRSHSRSAGGGDGGGSGGGASSGSSKDSIDNGLVSSYPSGMIPTIFIKNYFNPNPNHILQNK